MGDGIAAFFGLEEAREDDHDRAAMAAIEIRRLIGDYAAEVESAWGIRQLNVRVGVNSGRVAVGRLSTSGSQTHALGDAVNVASRLQGLAAPGSILLGSVVAATLADRFDLVSHGAKKVKGRESPVEAFELIGKAPAVRNIPSRAMLGREVELRRVTSAIREVRAGRGQMIFILGEAGIGKTRLLHDARSVSGQGVTWLEGRCDPNTRRLPYGPFTSALHDWLDLGASTREVAIRVRLRAKLRQLFGDSDPDAVAYLAGMLGVDLDPKERRRLEGLPVEALTRGLHAAYGRWLEALTRRDPVVIAIDNFAQADEATVKMTQDLLSLTETVPLLLLLSMRTEGSAPGWRLRTQALSEFVHRTSEVLVQPLTKRDSADLLASLDGERVLSEDVRAAITKRAEGNPLYVEELYHAVVAQEVAETSSSTLEAVPPGLERLLLSRVDALSRGARRLLQAAAVIGRSFEKAVLLKMGAATNPEAALRELLRADLIREHRFSPAEFQFKHGLIREAVLSTMTRGTTKELHRKTARAIEACYGPHLENHVAVLAEHYEAAGDHDNAVEFIEGVAERLSGAP